MRRFELQAAFEEIVGKGHAHFQPPASKFISYPAIIYSRREIRNDYADNGVYKQDTSYDVTVIDKDPDSEIVKKVSQLPKCSHERFTFIDNLNHDYFVIYE